MTRTPAPGKPSTLPSRIASPLMAACPAVMLKTPPDGTASRPGWRTAGGRVVVVIGRSFLGARAAPAHERGRIRTVLGRSSCRGAGVDLSTTGRRAYGRMSSGCLIGNVDGGHFCVGRLDRPAIPH